MTREIMLIVMMVMMIIITIIKYYFTAQGEEGRGGEGWLKRDF
jgi:hypothetical protein